LLRFSNHWNWWADRHLRRKVGTHSPAPALSLSNSFW
jgi:hypothetical protein